MQIAVASGRLSQLLEGVTLVDCHVDSSSSMCPRLTSNLSAHTCAYMHINAHTCNTPTHMHTHVYACRYKCACPHVHTHTHTHTYSYIFPCSSLSFLKGVLYVQLVRDMHHPYLLLPYPSRVHQSPSFIQPSCISVYLLPQSLTSIAFVHSHSGNLCSGYPNLRIRLLPTVSKNFSQPPGLCPFNSFSILTRVIFSKFKYIHVTHFW